MPEVLDVSVKGKRTPRKAIAVCGVKVVCGGRLVRIGEIFDEYWLERVALPDPEEVIEALRASPERPDIFTFAQRVPESEPRYQYRFELDNLAVLPVTTFQHWFDKQIPAPARRNVRAAEKRGIVVRNASYDDSYVKGIMGIYNESPVRAGRQFWHFGKDFDSVKRQNGTYADRSTYLAAYFGEEMVGYLKLVWDKETAAIMQILSKIAYREFRPNNALIAEAVKQCADRKVGYLLYEKFDYGNKREDSLTKFKQNNGFMRMEVPRYFVSMTLKGSLALNLGLQRRAVERLPEWMIAPYRRLRIRWYERKGMTTGSGV